MNKCKKMFINLSLVFVLLITLTSCGLFKSDNYKFGNIRIDLPENFEIKEQSGVIVAVSKDYPSVTDNITFVKSGKDNIGNYSQDILNDYYRQSFTGFKGISKYEEIRIGKTPALRVEFSMNMQGISMKQTQILIFYKKASYVLTFTVLNQEYNKIFEECINSIKIKWSLF